MRFRVLLVVCGLLMMSVWIAHAQDSLASCPALVEQALEAVGNNCANLDRNTACYGYNRVEATFTEVEPVGFFSLPADRAELATLETIRTAPLNLETQNWGVAIMNVQANVPDTLPGQAVTFVLMGDASLTNAAFASDTGSTSSETTSGPTVTVTVPIATDVRSSPSLESNVVGQLDSGAEVTADGLSGDGEWVHITSDAARGWINLSALSSAGEVSSLPLLEATEADTADAPPAPMQAFYFTSSVGQPTCAEAPSALAIQSPDNIKVDLTVNGANINVGSFVTFQSGENNSMTLTVHRGQVETESGRIIPAGQTSNAEMDSEGNIQSWGETHEATNEELLVGDTAQIITNTVTQGDGETTPDTTNNGPLYHIVQPGENLFRIALRYNTSVESIASANSITDIRRIFVGQQLLIPNPGSGFVNAPDAGLGATNLGGTTTTDIIIVDACAGFVGTSPIGRLPYGAITFYWDAAQGATQYRVNFYNQDGLFLTNRTTQGAETNLPFDSSVLGGGSVFLWDVEALANGQTICRTGLISTLRDDPLAGATAVPTAALTASWSCSGLYQWKVNFDYVPSGNSIVISFITSPPAGSGGTFAVPPNSQTFVGSGPTSITAGVVTASPSGMTVALPGTLNC